MTTTNIGLIPAAGEAKRMGPLPCSKEVLPIGLRPSGARTRVAAVSHVLLDRMAGAGIEEAIVVLRRGKEDIPDFLGAGGWRGPRLRYRYTDRQQGPPFTIDAVYDEIREARIAFGFPDILFDPAQAFRHLLDRQSATSADVVLGLFPAGRPDRMDMVDIDAHGRVRRVVIKPARTELRLTWIIAAWSPSFTRFLHEFVARDLSAGRAGRDRHMGEVVQAALDAGLRVDSETFAEGRCMDIGTPEDYMKALRTNGRLDSGAIEPEGS